MRRRRRSSEEAKDWRGSKRNLIEVKPSRLFVKEGGERAERRPPMPQRTTVEGRNQRTKAQRWTGQTNPKDQGSKDINDGRDGRIGGAKLK